MKVSFTTSLKNTNKTPFDATTFLKNTVPSYIQDDKYKQMVFFLQYYLEWLATKGNPLYILQNIENFIDVDNTPEEFINVFFNTFFKNIPINVIADKRLLLKHSRDLFKSKGTESAYKLLFKILYNEEIDINYPGQYLFETSNSNWILKNYIKINVKDNFLISPGIIGQKINGKTSHATAVIENVSSYYIGEKLIANYSIYNISGNFLLDEEIIIRVGNDEYDGNTIIPSPVVLNISSAGNNFNIGYSFIVNNNNDSFSLRIAQIQNDKIHSINILDGGEKYQIGEKIYAYQGDIKNNNFEAYISGVDENGKILNLRITKQAIGFIQFPRLKIISKYGKNANLEAVCPNCGAITSLDFLTAPNEFIDELDYHVINPKIDGYGEDAIIKIGQNPIATLKSNSTIFNSFASNNTIKLQDSKVNQRLSYIIKSGINFNEFIDTVRTLLHPAGYNIAGKYFAAINIKTGLFLGDINNINSTKYKFFTVYHYIKDLPIYITSYPARIFTRFYTYGVYDYGYRNCDVDRYKSYFDSTPVITYFGDFKIKDLYNENTNPKCMDIIPVTLPFQITFK